MQLSFIIVLIISIFISIFAIQNGGEVPIDLFFASYSVSKSIVILISVGSGALIAGILGAFKRIKKSREIRDLNKKIKSLEDEAVVLKEKLKNEENENQELEKINVDLKEEINKNKEILNELKEFEKNRKESLKEKVEEPEFVSESEEIETDKAEEEGEK